MPRILQVMGSAEPGGAETYFTKLVIALHQAGFEQHAIIKAHPERAQQLRDAGVSTLELPFDSFFDKTTRQAIRSDIAMFRPNIVQTWMYHAARAVPSGPYIHVGWLRGYQHLRDYRRCDQLIGMTQGIVNSVIQQGWPAERIHHLRPFAEAEPAPPIPRARYNTPEGVPLLLCLGRLHWHKAFDMAIQALPQLPEAHLWIVGDGSLHDDLMTFAKDVGVADRVHFVGWHEDVAGFYAAADVVVVPSRYEPFGLVMIEAWAHRRPLVTTKAAGPRATVQNNIDAVLVPIDDVDALAAGIRRVLEDATLREYLISHGRAHYERDYTMEAVVNQHRHFYQEILKVGIIANRRRAIVDQVWDRVFYRFKAES